MVQGKCSLPLTSNELDLTVKGISTTTVKKTMQVKRYSRTKADDLNKGYTITVPPMVTHNQTVCDWHLPHHTVLNPIIPEKNCRVLNGA